MSKLRSVIAVMLVILCWVTFANTASVPQIINYQGTLKDKTGTPVSGSVNMTFSVYSTATGAAPLWTENWSSTATPANPVIVNSGNFNVMLGALNPFPTTFFALYPKSYLGIKVGTDSEMLPRQQFASVGYSFAAGNGIPAGGIIMWSGTVSQIPDGWALCNGLNGTPDLRDKFIVGAGNTYAVGSFGGNSTISLSHTHAVGMATSGSHTHGGVTSGPSSNVDQRTKDDYLMGTVGGLHTHNITADGSHTHSAWSDSQLSASQDIRPPYYALAFIMKL